MKDKVIIVTGAARNIGLETARALAAGGAKVALVGRNQAALDEAAAMIGGSALAVVGEVSKADDVERIMATVAERFGGIDGLVNNAGVAYPNRVEKLDVAQVEEQIAVNFLAPILTCRAVIPYLRQRGGGRIVNVSSATVHTMGAFAHLSIYGATKAGLERFTEDLRAEVQVDKIAVTTFIPGDTATGFGTGWDEAATGDAYAAWLEYGPYCQGMMPGAAVGAQIAHCFALPDDCTFEFVMMRPVGRVSKVMEADG